MRHYGDVLRDRGLGWTEHYLKSSELGATMVTGGRAPSAARALGRVIWLELPRGSTSSTRLRSHQGRLGRGRLQHRGRTEVSRIGKRFD